METESASSTDSSSTLRDRVLITLLNAEYTSAPPVVFEQCDTLLAITAPRSACSALLFVGSIAGSSCRYTWPQYKNMT